MTALYHVKTAVAISLLLPLRAEYGPNLGTKLLLHVKADRPALTFVHHTTSLLQQATTYTMVYYFTSKVVDPPAFIYVGKDKVESTPQPHHPT